ncbi:DUF979 domain-containing protein [Phenylobacterium sp.]|uniref:DUF979 domain-containing protein n=1 Tax=Phenylobacterium sp. TaxID=1871053 RepID=UPI0011FA40E8|nr:DUF979 domain-containing protein [Phenylobacterium sp.]THD62889.1 MAG: DUF979 domain-containing protein [Phenylobacterium sp.]
MIKLGFVYVLAGLMFAGFAIYSARDAGNPKRFGNAAFWGLTSLSFLAGDRLGDLGNGVLVLALALLGALGLVGRGPARPADAAQRLAAAERQASAERLGARIFVPALVLPLVVAMGVLVLKPMRISGVPLMDPKQATLISLALAVIAALGAALVLLRQPPTAPFREGQRLANTVSWAALLPQYLAALGVVFATAGVGNQIGLLVNTYLPVDTRLAAVGVYCVGMAAFTMLMGNAFAAFPVLTGGVAIPILVNHFGGNPAVVSSLGMLSGFCGTLMTPLAANFNLVPPALLEIPDRYAVIKAQVPTALLMLIVNVVLMYVLAFR